MSSSRANHTTNRRLCLAKHRTWCKMKTQLARADSDTSSSPHGGHCFSISHTLSTMQQDHHSLARVSEMCSSLEEMIQDQSNQRPRESSQHPASVGRVTLTPDASRHRTKSTRFKKAAGHWSDCSRPSTKRLYLLCIVLFTCLQLVARLRQVGATSNINSVWLSHDATPSPTPNSNQPSAVNLQPESSKLRPRHPGHSGNDLIAETTAGTTPQQTLSASYSSLQPAVVSLDSPDSFSRRNDDNEPTRSGPANDGQAGTSIQTLDRPRDELGGQAKSQQSLVPGHSATNRRFRLAHINSSFIGDSSQLDNLWGSQANNSATVANQTALNQQVHFDEEQHNQQNYMQHNSNHSLSADRISGQVNDQLASPLDEPQSHVQRRQLARNQQVPSNRRPSEDSESTFVGSVGGNVDDIEDASVGKMAINGPRDKSIATTTVLDGVNATRLDATHPTDRVSELIYDAIPLMDHLDSPNKTQPIPSNPADGFQQRLRPDNIHWSSLADNANPNTRQQLSSNRPSNYYYATDVQPPTGGSVIDYHSNKTSRDDMHTLQPMYYLANDSGDRWTWTGQQRHQANIAPTGQDTKSRRRPILADEDEHQSVGGDSLGGQTAQGSSQHNMAPPEHHDQQPNGWRIRPIASSHTGYVGGSPMQRWRPEQQLPPSQGNNFVASSWPPSRTAGPRPTQLMYHHQARPMDRNQWSSKQWPDETGLGQLRRPLVESSVASNRRRYEQDYLSRQNRRKWLMQQHQHQQSRPTSFGPRSILSTLAAQLPRLGSGSSQNRPPVDENSFYDTSHGSGFYPPARGLPGENSPIKRRPQMVQANYWNRPQAGHFHRRPSTNRLQHNNINQFYHNAIYPINGFTGPSLRPTITPGHIRHPTVAPAASQLRHLYQNLHLTSSLAPQLVHQESAFPNRLTQQSPAQLAVAASAPSSSNHHNQHLPSSNFIPVVAVQVTRTSPAPSNPAMVPMDNAFAPAPSRGGQQDQPSEGSEITNAELDEYLETKTGQVNRQLLAQRNFNNKDNHQRVGQQYISAPSAGRRRVVYRQQHQADDFGSLASGSVSAPMRPTLASNHIQAEEPNYPGGRFQATMGDRQHQLRPQPASGSETTTIKSAVFGYLPHQADAPLLQAINLLPQLSDGGGPAVMASRRHRSPSSSRHQYQSEASEQQLAAYAALANTEEQQQPSLALQLQANSLVQNDIAHPFAQTTATQTSGNQQSSLHYVNGRPLSSRNPNQGLHGESGDPIGASLASVAQQQYQQLLNLNQQQPATGNSGPNNLQQAQLLANPLALLGQLDQQSLAGGNNFHQRQPQILGPAYELPGNMQYQYPQQLLFQPVAVDALGGEESSASTNNESPQIADGELGADESAGGLQTGDNSNIDQATSSSSTSSRNRGHKMTNSGKKRSSEFFASAGQLLISALPLLLAPTLGLMFANGPSFGPTTRLQQASGISSAGGSASGQQPGATGASGLSSVDGLVSSAGSQAYLFTPTPLDGHNQPLGAQSDAQSSYVPTTIAPKSNNTTGLMGSASNGFRQILPPSANNESFWANNSSTLVNPRDRRPGNNLQPQASSVTLPALTGFKYPNGHKSSTSPRPKAGNDARRSNMGTKSTQVPQLIASRTNYSTTSTAHPSINGDHLLIFPANENYTNATILQHQLSNGSFIRLDDHFESSPENQTIISPTTILFLSSGSEHQVSPDPMPSSHGDPLMEATRRVSSSLLEAQNNQTTGSNKRHPFYDQVDRETGPTQDQHHSGFGYEGADFDSQFATLRRPNQHRGNQQASATTSTTTTTTTSSPRHPTHGDETKRPFISYYSTTSTSSTLRPDRYIVVPSGYSNRNKYQYAEVRPPQYASVALSKDASDSSLYAISRRNETSNPDSGSRDQQGSQTNKEFFDTNQAPAMPRRRGRPPGSDPGLSASADVIATMQNSHKIASQSIANEDPITTELYPVSTWPQARRRTVSLVTSAGNRTLPDSSDKYAQSGEQTMDTARVSNEPQLRYIGLQHQQLAPSVQADRNRYQILQQEESQQDHRTSGKPSVNTRRRAGSGMSTVLDNFLMDQAAVTTTTRPQRIRDMELNYANGDNSSIDLKRRARSRRRRRDISISDSSDDRHQHGLAVGPLSLASLVANDKQQEGTVSSTTVMGSGGHSYATRANLTASKQKIKRLKRKRRRLVSRLNQPTDQLKPPTVDNNATLGGANESTVMQMRPSSEPTEQVPVTKRMSDATADREPSMPTLDANETLRRDASRSKSAIVTAMITQVADENEDDNPNRDDPKETTNELDDWKNPKIQANYSAELRNHLLEKKLLLDRIASNGLGGKTSLRQLQPESTSNELVEDQDDSGHDDSFLTDPLDGRPVKRQSDSIKGHSNRASRPSVKRKNVAAALELADDTKKALAKFGTLLLEDTLVQLPEPASRATKSKSSASRARRKQAKLTRARSWSSTTNDAPESDRIPDDDDEQVSSATERYATRTATQPPPRSLIDSPDGHELDNGRDLASRYNQRAHRETRVSAPASSPFDRGPYKGIRADVSSNDFEAPRWSSRDRSRPSEAGYRPTGGDDLDADARYPGYGNFTTTIKPTRDSTPLDHHSYGNHYSEDTGQRNYGRHGAYANNDPGRAHHDNHEHHYPRPPPPSVSHPADNYLPASHQANYPPPAPTNHRLSDESPYHSRPNNYNYHNHQHLYNRSTPLAEPDYYHQNHSSSYNGDHYRDHDHVGHSASPPTVQPRYQWPPEHYPRPPSQPNDESLTSQPPRADYYPGSSRPPTVSAYGQHHHPQDYDQRQHPPSGVNYGPIQAQMSRYPGGAPSQNDSPGPGSGSKLTDSKSVNEYLKRVQFSDSDRDKLMASYLTCDGLLNDNDHCLERLSCEFSDPQNIENANKLDRAVSSILLGHILINSYIPNQFKLRLKSASLFGYTQSGKCSKYICNKLNRSTSSPVQSSSSID